MGLLDTNAPEFTYDKVVCKNPNCMAESSFTPADLLIIPINDNICCEKCGKVIISNLPQLKKFTQTSVGFANEGDWY